LRNDLSHSPSSKTPIKFTGLDFCRRSTVGHSKLPISGAAAAEESIKLGDKKPKSRPLTGITKVVDILPGV